MSVLDAKVSVIRSVRRSRSFDCYSQPVSGICFSDDSRFLITSADDSSLQVFDVEAGRRRVRREDMELGVGKVCATHHNHTVLYCSTNSPSLCYYNWSRSRLIWQSADHSHRIISLCMSPSSDCFLSVSADYQVLFSDLRQRKAVYGSWLTEAAGTATASFDPTGIVFGVAYPCSGSSTVKLFDTRSPLQGPFLSRTVPGEVSVSSLEFSDNGALAMITTADNQISVLDALTMDLKQTIETDVQQPAASMAVFSGCSSYVLTGSSTNGELAVYEVGTGRAIHRLRHSGQTSALAWCKKYLLLACGSLSLALFLPSSSKCRD